MSRPAPKFAVGEEVYVLSEYERPGQWYEDIVIDIHYQSRPWRFKNDPIGTMRNPSWIYRFGDATGAEEKALRKKYPPSTESFDQLMQGLKRPQGVEA